ncbi:restriction endonuclease [Streptomyces sp. NPDC001404]|uniref:restriction endonuclease n=1 Tax=Streptomyces sp. NPDC001404 TaxID=3364571 RepID=UPI0036C7FCEB
MASTGRRPRASSSRTGKRRHPAARRGRGARARHRLTLGEWCLAGIGVTVVVTWITDYFGRHPGILAALLTLLGLTAAVTALTWGRRRYQCWSKAHRAPLPTSIENWRALSPGDFERSIARLCKRDGCKDVEVLGGSNDRAGDVKVRTPDGRRMLLQCKRYQRGNNVGAPVLYAVNGTYRVTHGCDLAAIVTTSSFTTSAVDWNADLAPQDRLRLVGERHLLAWADGTGPTPWA